MTEYLREIESDIVTSEFWLRMAWRARRLAQSEGLRDEMQSSTREVRHHLIRLYRLHSCRNFQRCIENLQSL